MHVLLGNEIVLLTGQIPTARIPRRTGLPVVDDHYFASFFLHPTFEVKVMVMVIVAARDHPDHDDHKPQRAAVLWRSPWRGAMLPL